MVDGLISCERKEGSFAFVYGMYFPLVKSRVTSRKVTNWEFVTDL